MPTFEPPTRKQYGVGDRLYERYGIQVGISLVWDGAHFVETPYPWLGEIADLQDGVTYFLGGHVYNVSPETAELLIADGYDVDLGTELLHATGVATIDRGTTYGNIWNDSSDATYVEFHNTDSGPYGDIPAGTTPTISELKIHFRASGHGPVASTIQAALYNNFDLIGYWLGGATDGFFQPNFGVPADFDIPNDATVREYTATAMVDGSHFAAIDVTTLLAGINGSGNRVGFASTNPATTDGEAASVRIYELWVEVTP